MAKPITGNETLVAQLQADIRELVRRFAAETGWHVTEIRFPIVQPTDSDDDVYARSEIAIRFSQPSSTKAQVEAQHHAGQSGGGRETEHLSDGAR